MMVMNVKNKKLEFITLEEFESLGGILDTSDNIQEDYAFPSLPEEPHYQNDFNNHV